MPKLPPITDKDIAAVMHAGQDVQLAANNLERRLRTAGSTSTLSGPAAAAVSAAGIAITFMELAQALTTRAALEEMKIATRKELEQR